MKRLYGLLMLLVCVVTSIAGAMTVEERTKLESDVRAAETVAR